jgi:DNA-binding beta-propeller fold protein YncE
MRSLALLLTAAGVMALTPVAMSQQSRAQTRAPRYQVQALWPRPFAEQSWVLGSITGVTVDAQNHVWVVHRGGDSLENNEKGMMLNPPSSSICCKAAPFVLEFDQAGALLTSWGGPGQGYQWPQSPGSLAVDAKGNVWITAAGLEPAPARGRGPNDPTAAEQPAAAAGRRGAGPAASPGPADAHVIKFARDGKFLLQIGTPGKMDGPDSQTTLNRPSAVAIDAAANEVFVADTGDRRIVVFDADSGKYKRHWFAYGEKSAGATAAPPPYSPSEPAAKAFRDVTCIEIARDGTVYVCDRSSNRIQVFQKNGTFVREAVVSKNTLGATVTGQFGVVSSYGSAWDVAFSNDAQQRYVFVANGHDKKVHILQRDTLTEVGAFGSGGRYPGQFLAVGSIATDAQGNVYTGEQHHGKRVQKFVPAK